MQVTQAMPSFALTIALCLAAFVESRAQLRALEPEQAGPDFPYQGEYLGEMKPPSGGKQVLAAQVSALGDGSFRAVFLPGGLPGAGWTGTGRAEAPGNRTAAGVTVSGAGYQALAAGDRIEGTGPGNAAIKLSKILRASPTMGMRAPASATVLFDGAKGNAWKAPTVIDARSLLGVPNETLEAYGTFSLHLEFRLPFEPSGRGQDRGNSGFCMTAGVWSELQILDSFGDPPAIDGCGALYKSAAPKVNACLPPLAWQTYDIRYTAPVFVNGNRTAEARITAWLNGILVQDKAAAKGRPALSPILLQDHGHPDFYRNIWILEGKDDFDFLAAAPLSPAPWRDQARVGAVPAGETLPGAGFRFDGRSGMRIQRLSGESGGLNADGRLLFPGHHGL